MSGAGGGLGEGEDVCRRKFGGLGVLEDQLAEVDVGAGGEGEGEEEAHDAHGEGDFAGHVDHRVLLLDGGEAVVDGVDEAAVAVGLRAAEGAEGVTHRERGLGVLLFLVDEAAGLESVDDFLWVVAEDAAGEADEGLAEFGRELLDEAEVEERDLVAGEGEDVARMRVGVEVAETDHGLHVDLADGAEQGVDVEAGLCGCGRSR